MPFSLPGIDNSQFSGAGYPDPLAPARSAGGTSIFNKPSELMKNGSDWVSIALAQAEEARKKREEEERQARLQQQFVEEAQQRQEQAQQQEAAHEAGLHNTFVRQNGDRFGDKTEDAYAVMRQAQTTAKQWAQTPDGMRFLSGGGFIDVNFADLNQDPLKYIASNKNYREFSSSRDALVSQGFPSAVADGLDVYFNTKDGEKEYKGQTGAKTANPVYEGLRGLGAPEPVAGIGAGLAGVIPVVGPAIAGASGGNEDVTSPEFLGEAASTAAAPAIPALGGPFAGAAEGLVPAGGSLLPAAARFAGRSAAGALINAGFEGANQLASGQFDPRALDTAAATGAAMENVTPALKTSLPLLRHVPPELLTAGATYGTSRALGQDNSDALQNAALAGIATSVARRGPVESLKTGFGLDRLLPRGAQGEPVPGLGITRVAEPDETGVYRPGNEIPKVGDEPSLGSGNVRELQMGEDNIARVPEPEPQRFAGEPPGEPPLPPAELPAARQPSEPAAPSDVNDIIQNAKDQVNTPRFVERAIAAVPGLGKAIVGLTNPAALFDTPIKKLVLAGAVARENARRLFENDWARTEGLRADQVLDTVLRDKGPSIGRVSAQTLGRAALEVAPPALGYAAGEALGLSDDQKKKLALAGLMLTAGLSYQYRKDFLRSRVVDDLKYIGTEELPKELQKGFGKLDDALENPDQYDWSALPPGSKELVQQLQSLRQEWLDTTNKELEDAGLAPVTARQANTLHHMWDAGSVADLKGDTAYTGGMSTTGLEKKIGAGRTRNLPDTFREAMQQNPGLKPAFRGDPRLLLRGQLNDFARMRANAVFLKAVQSDPEAARLLNPRELNQLKKSGLLDKDLKAAAREQSTEMTKARKDLTGQGWAAIPGFGDNWLFHPDVQAAVQRLFLDNQGKENPVIRALDVATTEIRQAAFVSDFSAWSLQGMMQVLQSPGTALRHSPTLLGATFLGRSFTDHWLSQHTDLLRDFLKAGGVLARETEGTEHTVRTLGDAPGIKNIERAGFSNYLPIHRLLTFQNERNINSFIQSLPAPIRNAYGAHAATAGLNVAKYGGLGAAAYALASQDDQSNWAKLAEIGLGGIAFTLGAKGVEGKLGKTLYDRLNPENQRDVNIRSAKTTNRVSGVYNKAQLGISNRQGTLERTLLVRSPALFRNMATILKLAAFNPGPEGAQALFYLGRTFVLTAALLGAAKMANGQTESFDPSDPDSVLNPKSLLRANFGEAGKLSFSNPYISLLRGVMNVEPVQGAPGGGEWSLKSAADGLRSFLIGRAPDVVGPTLYQQFAPEDSPGGNKSALTALGNDLIKGDFQKAATGTVGRFLPVAIRDVAKTGALGFTGLPGTEADPNFNSTGENVLGSVAPVAGLNFNPETRSQEAGRRESAAISQQFPGTQDFNGNQAIDRMDLNATQRAQFDASPEGQAISGMQDQLRTENQANNPDQPKSQIDIYLGQKASETDRHVAALKAIDDSVASGKLSKLKWKQAYADEQTLHRHNQAQIDASAKGQTVTDDSGNPRQVYDPKTGKSTTMDVLTYLSRGDHPEDQAVDGYYALYEDQSVHNVDNSMNWDKLDAAQQKYLADLDPTTRDYVTQRLEGFANKGIEDSKGNLVNLPTLGEYQSVKDAAQPFWDVRDQQFTTLQQKDKFFAQFQNYNDFQSQVQAAADAQGVQASDILSAISRRHSRYRVFDRAVTKAQRQLRGSNLSLDLGLQDFYNRPAVNWKAAIARTKGDHSYDTAGAMLARRPTGPSALQQQSFARRYGDLFTSAFAA